MFFYILLSLFLSISIVTLFFLWKTQDSVFKKICWTFIIFIPLLGPIFYGSLFEPPNVQAKHLRCNTVRTRSGINSL